ncbi:hypothetical protein FQR65_LT17235 [Abscondita terminalis]|nr:hypothetical protein FQR65_LT17235 [Abscondita terminalis]
MPVVKSGHVTRSCMSGFHRYNLARQQQIIDIINQPASTIIGRHPRPQEALAVANLQLHFLPKQLLKTLCALPHGQNIGKQGIFPSSGNNSNTEMQLPECKISLQLFQVHKHS